MSKYSELKLISLEDIRKIFVGADKEECVEIYNTLIETINKAEKYDDIVREVNTIEQNKPKMSMTNISDENGFNLDKFIHELSNYFTKISSFDYQLNEIFEEKYEKRINQLEQENQVLKDGVRALDYLSEYGLNDDTILINANENYHKELFDKIRAMIEVLEK